MNIHAQAAAYVREGWCRGTLQDDDGNVCIAGAINKAISGNPRILCKINIDPDVIRGAAVAKDQLGQTLYDYYQIRHITNWNDKVAESQAEVAYMLDLTAKHE